MKRLLLILTIFVMLSIILVSCKSDVSQESEIASSQSRVIEGLLGRYYDTDQRIRITDCGEYITLDYLENPDADFVLPTVFANGMKINSVSNQAFSGNKDIIKLTVPDGYKYIDSFAFMDCSNLETVTLGKDVYDIGEMAFAGCYNIKEIIVSEQNPNLYAKNNAIIDKHENKVLFSTSYLPQNATAVYHSAFRKNKNINDVILPDTVSLLGSYCFSDSSLKSVVLSAGLLEIKTHAFQNTELTDIYIPECVEKIESAVFYGIDGITINCESTSKPDGWDDKWLDGCTNYTINWGVTREE